jgi:hypothetical protein
MVTDKPNNFLNLLDSERKYRWPQKDDRLIKHTDDFEKATDFSSDPTARHVHIWTGYMLAGAALVEYGKQSPVDRHFLIYPILYNYRQGIELALKWFIWIYGKYTGKGYHKNNNHDLWHLWKTCKEIIVEIGGPGESLEYVEQVIKDFHELDKKGTAFRYPFNQDGSQISLPQGLVDPENIREVMDGLQHFFDGSDGQLSDLVSNIDY